MTSTDLKELVPGFLKTIENSSYDEQILSYQILQKFLSWINKNKAIQKPDQSCEHKWYILEQYMISQPHWFDSRPIQKLVVIQRCRCGQLKKNIL